MARPDGADDQWLTRIAERDRQRAEFVGTVSHDLKTPLNAIVGFTSVLLADADGLLPEQARQLRLVNDSARSLLARINGLLEFHRLQAGKVDLLADWFYPAELLLQVVEGRRPQAAGRGCELALEVTGGPVRVRADARLVRRVLEELLDNAIRFGGSGTIRLSLAAGSAKDPGRGLVRFGVRDPGRDLGGPATEALRRAFDPGVDAFERSYRGLGLGLALAREAALALGGFVELAAGPDRDTCFCLVLELDDQDVQPG